MQHLTKLALIVEYDGSRYHGFQIQPLLPTVQGVLEQAVLEFTGQRSRLGCASRTDAGVHAEAQVVSLRTESAYAPETWVRALNHHLPEDVAVKAAYVLPDRYNVRACAIGRRYQYRILNRASPSPLSRGRAFWVHQTLDVGAMNKAAVLLLGERDMAPFCSSQLSKGASTVRRLTNVEFHKDGEYVIFEVEGNAFLPQQVRRMAGALVQVGLGRQTIEDFQGLADGGRRSAAGPTLPGLGLTLVEVLYPSFPPSVELTQQIAG